MQDSIEFMRILSYTTVPNGIRCNFHGKGALSRAPHLTSLSCPVDKKQSRAGTRVPLTQSTTDATSPCPYPLPLQPCTNTPIELISTPLTSAKSPPAQSHRPSPNCPRQNTSCISATQSPAIPSAITSGDASMAPSTIPYVTRPGNRTITVTS